MPTSIVILATFTILAALFSCRPVAEQKAISTSTLSSEVDSFTPRMSLPDRKTSHEALEELNRVTRLYLSDAIDWANQQPECDGWCMALIVSETLAASESKKQVEERLSWARQGRPHVRLPGKAQVPGWRGYSGAIESLVSKGVSKDGRFQLEKGPLRLTTQESIFHNVSRLDSPGSFLEVGSVLPVESHPTSDLEDSRTPDRDFLYIGSDKFGHFLATGFEYLEAYAETLDDIQKSGDLTIDAPDRALFATLHRGALSEITLLGGWTARVFSYGDLASNFAGFSFYKEIVAGTSPYVQRDAQTSRWRLGNAVFSWGSFIDAGWDEAINCSHYYPSIIGRDDFQRKVVRTLVERGEAVTQDLTCPISIDACRELWSTYKQRYGDFVGDSLVSPQCSEVARKQREKPHLTREAFDKTREYFDRVGFYSGPEITRRSKTWCRVTRDQVRTQRCKIEGEKYESLDSCLMFKPHQDVENFRCQMDGADLAGWAL